MKKLFFVLLILHFAAKINYWERFNFNEKFNSGEFFNLTEMLNEQITELEERDHVINQLTHIVEMQNRNIYAFVNANYKLAAIIKSQRITIYQYLMTISQYSLTVSVLSTLLFCTSTVVIYQNWNDIKKIAYDFWSMFKCCKSRKPAN